MPTLSAISEVIGGAVGQPANAVGAEIPPRHVLPRLVLSLAAPTGSPAGDRACRPPLCALPCAGLASKAVSKDYTSCAAPAIPRCHPGTVAGSIVRGSACRNRNRQRELAVAGSRPSPGMTASVRRSPPPTPPAPGGWRRHRERAGSARPARRRAARRRGSRAGGPSASAPVSWPMKLLREAPSSTAQPSPWKMLSEPSSARLCASVLPKPMPGSTISRARGMPAALAGLDARAPANRRRRARRRRSAGSSCMVRGSPWACIRTTGRPVSAAACQAAGIVRQRRDVVDEMRRPPARRAASPRPCGYRSTGGPAPAPASACDHRQDAPALLLEVDRLGAGPRRTRRRCRGCRRPPPRAAARARSPRRCAGSGRRRRSCRA